jgi:hypothetical protein
MHPLRAQAREGEQGGDPRRHLARQFVEHRQAFATGDDGDLVGKVAADAR